MSKIRHAVIMAAGRGMRMMPFTEHLPKAMAPYEESTLVANGIEKIKEHIENIHITVGYKGAILAKHVIEHKVSSVFNTEGKGNAWWIFNTLLSNIDEPVFVLTCDNVLDLDFDLIEKEYFEFGQPACMVVPVAPVDGLDGDFIFQESNIVTELNRNKPSNQYCSGIQVLHLGKIRQLSKPLDDFNTLWRQLIEKKQVYCSNIYPKKWFTVDTLEALRKVNKEIFN